MRSASGAGETPSLPPDLQPDHDAFARALRPWLAGRSEGARELQLLTRYGALVHEQSNRLSLVARSDRSTIFTRHVLDSLNPVSLFETPPISALDIGSGAGFPGIPLAIAWPTCTFVLVESREKKAGFLERVARELGLANVTVACSRIEDLNESASGPVPRPGLPARAAFIRALGDLPVLLARISRVSVPRSPWVYFLGSGARAEETLADLERAGVQHERFTGQFGGGLVKGWV